jgi:TonB family protein
MSIDPELRLLLEWENEAARWRRRTAFLLGVIIQIVLGIFLAISPHLFHFGNSLVAENVQPEPRPRPTMLVFPPGLARRVRKPPPTNLLSDKNRRAQGPSPKVNPKGLMAPYLKGNTKLPELAGGGHPHPPAPPPSPAPVPPTQAAANPRPKAVVPPPPKQEAQLRLMNLPASPRGGKSAIKLPSDLPGQEIRQSVEAAARDQGSGTAVGPGDSPDQFQNLNPNFSTAGPLILSNTRGFNFGPYLARVVYIVRRNWYAVIPEAARLGEKGRVALVFEIVRDGSVNQLRLVGPSGSSSLDLAALASIKASNPFPPLPSGFTGKHLVLEFIYLYNLGTNY